MTAAGQTELVALFADMGQRIGLSRPAGQCFAAIWRAAQAPSADDLVTELGLSRSNVSTALKELRSWGLIGRARAPGDRRDRFTAPADPWAIARQILAERQRRELAPALDRLYAIEAVTADARVAALCEVLEGFAGWYGGLARLDPGELAAHVTEHPASDDNGRKKKKKKKN
ncbi:hypothetical protein CCR83_09175 [Rhodobacter veldkampii DSM 11550]|uniref:ArsR family transcriptional regulator n=1 Tax=Phaeovulum veldkampii DSM 11550 TaxID=1185920 RepID=A0A2T4JM40_9RHOB|nr:MarR family transcriptional regulator [Phaeovulum veldkampii]MBK5946598.1 hypothetical protein [Phaeovulum veldkampii DSM 11550]PTE18837.1 ArsR family transcriptional regulator [Phaeovulum veldkampii DSM 11550]TDQ59930.1 MarR family protein [Phaeovulum veldkampii DSM 11550]